MVDATTFVYFFFSSRRRHTRLQGDWSSDVCSSDLPRIRRTGVLTGAFCLGAGIWAMHFIGMLAFVPCTFGDYDPWITALSMLPSMLASWLALTLMVRPRLSAQALVGGGVLMGLGIGSMHYIGMAAAQTWSLMLYDPWGVLLSVIVAATMAMLSLWVRFRLGNKIGRASCRGRG